MHSIASHALDTLRSPKGAILSFMGSANHMSFIASSTRLSVVLLSLSRPSVCAP
jgi:hypothetical protein